MPEAPAEVLEALALLEVAGHLGADLEGMKGGDRGDGIRTDLPCLCEGLGVA